MILKDCEKGICNAAHPAIYLGQIQSLSSSNEFIATSAKKGNRLFLDDRHNYLLAPTAKPNASTACLGNKWALDGCAAASAIEKEFYMDTKLTRRKFMQTGAVVTAEAVAEVVAGDMSKAATPHKKIASLSEIKAWSGVAFLYPESQPAMLVDVGKQVPGGVGPQRSIVAFSTLCQHMGCPVALDAADQKFVCPCHNSIYDPAREGMAIAGPAIEGLPMIALKVENNEIYAVGMTPVKGISSGLVYGLACDKT